MNCKKCVIVAIKNVASRVHSLALRSLFVAAGLAVSSMPTSALAQVSTNSISLQAKIEGVIGTSVNLRVRFYDAPAPGGIQQGPEIILNNVPIQNGIVSVPVSPIDPTVFNGQTRYMEIIANGTTLPRQLITSVPYAVLAASAQQLGANAMGVGQLGVTATVPIIARSGNTEGYAWLSGNAGWGGRLLLAASTPAQQGVVELYVKNNGNGNFAGTLILQDLNSHSTTLTPTLVTTPVLQITGGSDLVEGFDSQQLEIEPGTLMVIDPEHPGQVQPSSRPYDTKVAGVVSGAGGVSPGIRMGQNGALDGKNLIAMTGRVYVKCSAANGAIRPGDRLTTSALAGHAMKATEVTLSDGAVIGKAMSSLDAGTGLVLVLVNLQ